MVIEFNRKKDPDVQLLFNIYLQYECSKNEDCQAFAFKPRSTEDCKEEENCLQMTGGNCNILDEINTGTDGNICPGADGCPDATGWTLYKCQCCSSDSCKNVPAEEF